jgi:hypothetical protein
MGRSHASTLGRSCLQKRLKERLTSSSETLSVASQLHESRELKNYIQFFYTHRSRAHNECISGRRRRGSRIGDALCVSFLGAEEMRPTVTK